MGPMATMDVFRKIILHTQAERDQDHHKIIVMNNPKIPSRNEAILKSGQSPLEQLILSAKALEEAGADFIIMPCNTAHLWYDDLQKEVTIPILNMIKITAETLKNTPYKHKQILLLATSGTVYSKLYQKELESAGLFLCVPSKSEQKIISSSIEAVKRGLIKNNPYLNSLNKIIKKYYSKNVTIILSGCTEIPLLFPHLENNCEKIDTNLLLAQAAIHKAREEQKVNKVGGINMQTKHIQLSGKVQGVGFRRYTYKQALLYNIVGWVKNNPNGTVEVVAQGSSENMKLFIKRLKKGPKKARVTEFKCLSVTHKTNYTNFKIRSK